MADDEPTKAGNSSGLTLRELVSSLIALAIVAVGLWMLVETFIAGGSLAGGGDSTGFEGRKEILLIAVGLLGTVTGYYFGRIPAERQADAAREEAASAQGNAANAEARSNDLAGRQTRALATLEAAAATGSLEAMTRGDGRGVSAIEAAIAELRSGPRP